MDITNAVPAPRYSRRFLTASLSLMCAISALNYIDRNVITILLQPIKQDLGLSDTQAGLMSGLAFAAVYSVLAVPLARIADRGFQVRVLNASVAVWSIATALCSGAGSFVSLFLARMGVGVGEAGGTAPMQALIAEYFSPQARARAIGALSVAAGVGSILGFALSGFLSDRYGWRATFLILGIPGIVVALLSQLTLREPRPAGSIADGVAADAGLRIVLADLMSRRSYVHMAIGLSIAAIGLSGIAAWTPAFFMREHGMTATQIGSLSAVMAGPGAMIGILLGGFMADRLSQRDPRWPVWLFMIGIGGVSPLYLLMLLSHSAMLAIVVSLPTGILASLWIAPGGALIQNLAGAQSRATAAAIFMLSVNLIGLGLGPLLTGALSDVLLPHAGNQSLRYAMCVMLLTLVYGSVHFAIATRTVAADLIAASRTTPAAAATSPNARLAR